MFFYLKHKGGRLLKSKDFLTEILTKPVRYSVLIASLSSITALLLAPLFLPNELPYATSILEFINKYSGIIFTIYIVSFFLLIFQLVPDLYRKYQLRSSLKSIKKMQNELYKDELAWSILLELYHANSDAVLLVASNQKVKLLQKLDMIILTSDRTLVSAFNMHKAEYPYVLHPETEKYMKKHVVEI